MESQAYEVSQCLQAALGNLESHHSTFIKCSHTDDDGLTDFFFPNTGLEQLCFEVSVYREWSHPNNHQTKQTKKHTIFN